MDAQLPALPGKLIARGLIVSKVAAMLADDYVLALAAKDGLHRSDTDFATNPAWQHRHIHL